ncbi:MAG: C69 family dipeptidase, partial [Candidatus Rifleibacteriota bacterium]
GYGQVARLVKRKNGICHLLWIAPTGSVTAPFIPYRVGVSEVPPEFGQHRYLYKDAGRKFLTTEFQSQEATLFAGRLFKRLLYHTSENPEIFLEDVQNSLIEFEDKLFEEQKDVEATIQALMKSGNEELAVKYMTFYSNTRAKDALELGKILVDYVESRTRLKKGIRRPGSRKINSDGGTTPNCLIGHDPDQSEH